MSHEIRTKAGNRVWSLLLADREDEIEEADILAIEAEAAADSLRPSEPGESVGPAAAEPPDEYGPGDRRRGYSKKWDRLFAEADERAAQSPNPQGEPPRGSLPPCWDLACTLPDGHEGPHSFAGGSLTATAQATPSEEPPGHCCMNPALHEVLRANRGQSDGS